MCTRYAIASAVSAIEGELQAAFDCSFTPAYNASAGCDLPVLVDADHRIKSLRWGMVPAWSRSVETGEKNTNAWAGKVARHSVYRVPLRRSRCLVPANCYYIWIGDAQKRRVPHVVYFADQRIFTMAGLWDTWADSNRGTFLRTFSIVTTRACERLQPYAATMPVIISPSDRRTYLKGGVPLQRITSLLRPHETEHINLYPVSDAINDPKAEGKQLLLPAGQRLYREYIYKVGAYFELEGMGSRKDNPVRVPVSKDML